MRSARLYLLSFKKDLANLQCQKWFKDLGSVEFTQNSLQILHCKNL